MKSLIKLNKDEHAPSCSICVYSKKTEDSLFCTKKKKQTQPDKKCRKFEVNIMSLGVRRKRTIEVDINPDDYSIE